MLDPFLGSGTTALAALSSGRNSVGVEVEAAYLELAEERLGRAAAVERIAGAIVARVQLD